MMEDFGFKLQDLKYRYWLKRSVQAIFVLLAITFFAIIIIKLFKLSTGNNRKPVENVVLIKSKGAIKRTPEDKGGMNVGNLDISVYDVIDNNKTNDKLKVNNTTQTVGVNDKNSQKLNEQELLNQKIDEIAENIVIANESVDGAQRTRVSANITVRSDNKASDTVNTEGLQSLGNAALVNNIKNKKDIKPGIRVQVLALRSQDGLERFWNNLKKDYPSLLNDKNYYIETADLGDSTVIHRLQIGNFKDKNEATKFCEEYIKLTNKNKVDCIII